MGDKHLTEIRELVNRPDFKAKPLLILKPRRVRLLSAMLKLSCVGAIYPLVLFTSWSEPNFTFYAVLGSFPFLIILYIIFLAVVLQDMRVYKDRIAVVRKYGTELSILFSEASLYIGNEKHTPFFMKPQRSTRLYVRGGGGNFAEGGVGLFHVARNITCSHNVYTKDDIHRLHCFLAELSGRSVDEFETGETVDIKYFMAKKPEKTAPSSAGSMSG